MLGVITRTITGHTHRPTGSVARSTGVHNGNKLTIQPARKASSFFPCLKRLRVAVQKRFDLKVATPTHSNPPTACAASGESHANARQAARSRNRSAAEATESGRLKNEAGSVAEDCFAVVDAVLAGECPRAFTLQEKAELKSAYREKFVTEYMACRSGAEGRRTLSGRASIHSSHRWALALIQGRFPAEQLPELLPAIGAAVRKTYEIDGKETHEAQLWVSHHHNGFVKESDAPDTSRNGGTAKPLESTGALGQRPVSSLKELNTTQRKGRRLEASDAGRTAASFCSRIRSSVGNALHRAYRLVVGERSGQARSEADAALLHVAPGEARARVNETLPLRHCKALHGLTVAENRQALSEKLPRRSARQLVRLDGIFDKQHGAMLSAVYRVDAAHADRLPASERPSAATAFWLACEHTDGEIFGSASPQHRESMTAAFPKEYPQWQAKISSLPADYLDWMKEVLRESRESLQERLCVPVAVVRKHNPRDDRTAK